MNTNFDHPTKRIRLTETTSGISNSVLAGVTSDQPSIGEADGVTDAQGVHNVPQVPQFELYTSFQPMRPDEFERRFRDLIPHAVLPTANGSAAEQPPSSSSLQQQPQAQQASQPSHELSSAYRQLWERNDACELAFTRQRLEFTFLK